MSKKNDNLTLKKARKILKLTQEQLADEWGIHKENISRWETKKHKPLGIFQEKIDALIARAKIQLVVDGCMSEGRG